MLSTKIIALTLGFCMSVPLTGLAQSSSSTTSSDQFQTAQNETYQRDRRDRGDRRDRRDRRRDRRDDRRDDRRAERGCFVPDRINVGRCILRAETRINWVRTGDRIRYSDRGGRAQGAAILQCTRSGRLAIIADRTRRCR